MYRFVNHGLVVELWASLWHPYEWIKEGTVNHMVSLLRTTVRAGAGLFAAACLSAAYGQTARPGTVNYTEGQVNLNGQAIDSQSSRSEVAPGQVLETRDGRAEMLLTPGVYLRIGDNSAIRMVAPSITDTQVELLRGEANLEVDMLAPQNHLSLLDNGAQVTILKNGIYSLTANPATLRVYDGKAEALVDEHTTEVGKGRELALVPEPKLKTQSFDRNQTDPLYAWSKLRSQYEAQANASAARMVVENGYPGWFVGTGWYWDPWCSSWAFLPGSGYFYNPWGFGFYSPAFWYYGGPGFHGGFRGPVARGFAARSFAPAMRAPMMHGFAGGRR